MKHPFYRVFRCRARDPMSSFTHLLAAIGSVILALILAVYSHLAGGTVLQTVSFLIFGLSLTALYTASSVFHFYNSGNSRIQLRLRKLDHSMIYVLIAGSYTPFLICALGTQAVGWIAVIWGIALTGIAVKLICMNLPRVISTAFYLALGWIIVIIPNALRSMPLSVLTLTAAGGISYSVGAVIYALKKPNFGKTWGFHEIFHLFVILGSLLQIIALFVFVALEC